MIRTVFRIVATSLLLVALVASGVATARAVSHSANRQVTKAQAVEYARAVDVRAADVPGLKPGGPPEEAVSTREPGRFLRCLKVGRAKVLFAIRSQQFRAATWAVSSEVEVLPNEGVATASVAALGARRGGYCIRLGAEAGESYALRRTRLSRGARGVADHLVVRYHRLGLRADEFVFAAGRALITLLVLTDGKRPPAATEQRLVSLLYSRANANKL